MWRSFFLAVGIGLMGLGVEALVFERVVVNQTAKLPNFLNGLFEKNYSDSLAIAENFPSQSTPTFQDSGIQNPNASNFQRVPYSSTSRFGPSRFSGPQSGGYGGGRVDLSRSGISTNNAQAATASPVSFANDANPASSSRDSGIASQIQGPRTIVTKDWMPWSLLATGVIIFLYTSSHGRSKNEY